MKPLRLLGVLAVLLALISGTAYAEPAAPPGSWITDFTILNLENQPATVAITRYGLCGTPGCSADAGTLVKSVPIAANGSAYYNPGADPTFPSPFAGSIVLSSDRLLASTVTLANDQSGSLYASDAYPGISDVAQSVFLPIIMAQLGPWNTLIAVQNAGTGNANVTIDYIGAGAPAQTTITNLPPNMSVLVDQASAGVTGFNGSARVTSNQPLAITVDEYKNTGGVLIAYAGVPLTQADSTIYMPGFIAQGVWATDFSIVNTEAASADVQITFASSGATMSGSIPANGAAYINGFAGVKPAGWSGMPPVSGYYGSATVTSTNGKKLVVVYNIANSGGGPGNRQMGYVGFGSSRGALTVADPLIEHQYSTGWNTTFSVQKIEAGNANLQMYYSGNKAPLCNPCTFTLTDAAPAHNFNQTTDGHVPTGFLGGMAIVSNKKIVVIADQDKNSTAGDTAAGFPGVPVPAP